MKRKEIKKETTIPMNPEHITARLLDSMEKALKKKGFKPYRGFNEDGTPWIAGDSGAKNWPGMIVDI